jgi:hypothetical protein
MAGWLKNTRRAARVMLRVFDQRWKDFEQVQG